MEGEKRSKRWRRRTLRPWCSSAAIYFVYHTLDFRDHSPIQGDEIPYHAADESIGAMLNRAVDENPRQQHTYPSACKREACAAHLAPSYIHIAPTWR